MTELRRKNKKNFGWKTIYQAETQSRKISGQELVQAYQEAQERYQEAQQWEKAAVSDWAERTKKEQK